MASIDVIFISGISPELGKTPVDLVNTFRSQDEFAPGSYTGGSVPAHFWIPSAEPHGTVYQLHALTSIATLSAHSAHAVGIALECDLESELPRDHQLRTIAKLAAILVPFFGGRNLCRVEGAGKNLNMGDLRFRIDNRIKSAAHYEPHQRLMLVTGYGILI